MMSDFEQGVKNRYCIYCGSSLPDKALFCPACGEKITRKAESEEPLLRPMRCTTCGSSTIRRIGTGKYRCEHCGTIFYRDGQEPGEDAYAQDAQVAALLSEAQEYGEKKDYRNEIKILAKAMELAPEDNNVLLRLGRAYWRNNLPEKALGYYRIAEELYPDDPIVYSNIGAACLKLGHNAEAKAQYEKGIDLIESNPMSASGYDIAVTYGNYALCLGRMGDRKAAKKYLSIAKEKGYSRESIDSICEELHLIKYLL